MKLNISRRAMAASVFSVILLSTLLAFSARRIAFKVESKAGGCVILPYDFDVMEKDFPEMNLPDNALLVLAMQEGEFRPELITAVQNGHTYPPVGIVGHYHFGYFYILYFDTAFSKYKPYEIRLDEGRALVSAEKIKAIKGGAKPVGRIPWRDPVTDTSVRNTRVIDLPYLLARGRAQEYAEVALLLRGKGGLALVRMEAMDSLDKKEYIRAAVLSGEIIKWSKALEPPDVRRLGNFHDWITIARAFKGMGEPLAAVRAYDEALGLVKDNATIKARKATWKAYEESAGETEEGEPFIASLSEAEIELEPHGKIPIPREESGVIREGVSAGGVYIGDHKQRIRAQCGDPTEAFSTMLLYLDHPICPESVFFTGMDQAYSIRAVRGKTTRGVAIGDSMAQAAKIYGKPDRRVASPTGPNKKPSLKWIYLKHKTAFIDLNGNGVIDAVDVFDYSLNR